MEGYRANGSMDDEGVYEGQWSVLDPEGTKVYWINVDPAEIKFCMNTSDKRISFIISLTNVTAVRQRNNTLLSIETTDQRRFWLQKYGVKGPFSSRSIEQYDRIYVGKLYEPDRKNEIHLIDPIR